MDKIQFWILILGGIIWLALRLFRRKPEDTQQQRKGDDIFTESEMNLPWQQIPQEQQIFAEYDEEEEFEEELSIERIEENEEPPTPQPVSSPTLSTDPKRETSQQDTIPVTSDTPAHSQQRTRQPKQIAGIPLNTKSVKFGIVISEILNKPKSQRPQI